MGCLLCKKVSKEIFIIFISPSSSSLSLTHSSVFVSSPLFCSAPPSPQSYQGSTGADMGLQLWGRVSGRKGHLLSLPGTQLSWQTPLASHDPHMTVTLLRLYLHTRLILCMTPGNCYKIPVCLSSFNSQSNYYFNELQVISYHYLHIQSWISTIYTMQKLYVRDPSRFICWFYTLLHFPPLLISFPTRAITSCSHVKHGSIE